MRAATVYIADDGARFDREDDCRAHEALVAVLAEILRPLGVRPKDFTENAYVQHDPAQVQRMRLAVLRLRAERGGMGDVWARTIAAVESGKGCQGGIASRCFGDEGGIIAHAWHRLCLIDDRGREVQQAYFVFHPEEVTREIGRTVAGEGQ